MGLRVDRRRCAALVLGLALAFGIGAQDSGATPVAPPDLVILHFNDFHGQVLPHRVEDLPGRPVKWMGGYPALHRVVRETRERYGDERVWVTNGGDWYQGTPEGNADRGRGILELFDHLGVTVSVLGNHEYDHGEDSLLGILAHARHPILGANVRDAGAPADPDRVRPHLLPYVVRVVAGLRVAVVGLVTRDTPTMSTGPFGGAAFVPEERALRDLMPALRRSADAVILLTHCGLADDRALARAFPDLTLILGGHSHTFVRRPLREGPVWIVQSGARGAALTRLHLRVREHPRRLEVVDFAFLELPALEQPEPRADGFVRERFGALAASWDTPIAEVDGDPDTRRGPGSTPGGNFLCDLLREAGQAEVAVTNKGGIRDVFPHGPLTRRRVFEIVPFDNTVVTLEVRGRDLRAALAHGLASPLGPLEIAGASYEYVVRDGRRELGRVEIGGEELRQDRIYRVATNSFLAAGGDGHEAFKAGKELGRSETYIRDLVVQAALARKKIRLSADPRVRFSP